jgi:hypothetical protein
VVASEATIDVTGKQAEILLAGETKWKPLPAGSAELPKGAKVRIGNKTTAKLVARARPRARRWPARGGDR